MKHTVIPIASVRLEMALDMRTQVSRGCSAVAAELAYAAGLTDVYGKHQPSVVTMPGVIAESNHFLAGESVVKHSRCALIGESDRLEAGGVCFSLESWSLVGFGPCYFHYQTPEKRSNVYQDQVARTQLRRIGGRVPSCPDTRRE